MATYHGRIQINGSLTRGVLRLRQAMDTKSKVLAEMPDGTELDVTLTSGKTWFKTTYNGQAGYVRAVDIAITEGYPLYRVNVSKGTLNIRSVPKTGDNVVFTAAKDRGLYVLETSGDWYLVSCNIGTGWASKTYLVKDPSAVPFDYVTVDELIDRLKSFCGEGWSYKLGYSSTNKTIDCANYPYVARFSLGNHNVPAEYNDISDDEKGTFTDASQLKVGMEVFQPNPDKPSELGHMGVYAGLVNFNGQMLHAVYQSRAIYNPRQKAIYSEETGPNLTEMNEKWDHWGWSKYVKH